MKGFPLMDAFDELHKINDLSEVALLSFQENQRNKILEHHFQNTPYYTSLIGAELPASWEDVPVMTKADLQLPLKDRLSIGFAEKDCYINKTSGSSGHPFIFAKDKYCHALTWASIITLYRSAGIEMGEALEARFYGIPLEPIGHAKERIKDTLSHRVRFPIFDLSDKVLTRFLDKFSKRPFQFINGYTSSLVLFAKYLEERTICLKDVCPSLKICIVTSEMLFEEDLKLLQKSFGVPIYNEYGASELGVIGFSEALSPMEVVSSLLYVELLDDFNQPVAEGEIGRIVITSLYNKAHPLIRYDIGDMGVMDPKSSKAKPRLKELVGRTNDVAILANEKKVPGLTFYYVTKSIIAENSPIKEFVVEQHSLDDFLIKYVSSIGLSDAQKTEITKALNKYVGKNLKVEFKQLEVLDRSRRGKLKQFIKLF